MLVKGGYTLHRTLIKHIGSSVLRALTLLFAAIVITFLLAEASPIDPIDAYVGSESGVSEEQKLVIAEYWGLNDPPLIRLKNWLLALLHGDMGVSLYYQQPVLDVISERFMLSISLMAISWLLSGILGFTLGIIAAAYQNKWIDKIIKRGCLLLSSAPTFWVGLLLLMIFAVWLGILPVGLSAPIGSLANEVSIGEKIRHLILPALTLSIVGIPTLTLHTRQKLIHVLGSEYCLFASARGETKWEIIRRHGLRNILLPAITIQFGAISELFGGAVLAENVFSYTGIGQAAVKAGTHGDVPLLLGITLFSALFVFVGNLIANMLYPVIDPQIREGLGHETN